VNTRTLKKKGVEIFSFAGRFLLKFGSLGI